MVVENLGITPAAAISSEVRPFREASAEVIGDDSTLVISRHRHGDEEHGDHGAEEPHGNKGYDKGCYYCTSLL